MLSLKPIPEDKASEDVAQIYSSIKQTFGLANVPIVFQYLAVFPKYLSYIWQQALANLQDISFKNQSMEIEKFAQNAIQSVFTPSPLSEIFLEKLEGRAEKQELSNFVKNVSRMNASLYLFSLAIRESLKGRYLGIKQIGEKLEEKEKSTFNDISEGFFAGEKKEDKRNTLIEAHPDKRITVQQKSAITTSVFAQFFEVMEKEMKELLKKEKYLTRRVELERFALSKLHLMPHPLESSISTIFTKAYDHPQFPELIYLTSDLFPTQTPFKLMASAVMKESLNYKIKPNSPEGNNKLAATNYKLQTTNK